MRPGWVQHACGKISAEGPDTTPWTAPARGAASAIDHDSLHQVPYREPGFEAAPGRMARSGVGRGGVLGWGITTRVAHAQTLEHPTEPVLWSQPVDWVQKCVRGCCQTSHSGCARRGMLGANAFMSDSCFARSGHSQLRPPHSRKCSTDLNADLNELAWLKKKLLWIRWNIKYDPVRLGFRISLPRPFSALSP